MADKSKEWLDETLKLSEGWPTNKYEPNERDWQVGDYVLHNFDAKTHDMLMQVIRVHTNGLIVTTYPFKKGNVNFKLRYYNHKKHLLDPADFGIMINKGGEKLDGTNISKKVTA